MTWPADWPEDRNIAVERQQQTLVAGDVISQKVALLRLPECRR